MTVVEDIEAALVLQWSHFGRWPRGRLYEDDLVRFETPIPHLPYNGVIRTRLPDSMSADNRIAEVTDSYRRRDVQVFWLDHPSATPANLGARLRANGLRAVETMHGMSLELASWTAPPTIGGVVIEEVLDDKALAAYTALTLRYWEIPDAQADLVVELHRYWGPSRAPGTRFVARLEGDPVGKAYVLLDHPPGVASIYGMSVIPEARGRGVARALTAALVNRADEAGSRLVVLHSTDMAHELYRKAGFHHQCQIPVYATAPLWSDPH